VCVCVHTMLTNHAHQVTEDNIIQLGPNHVIFSDYYTFELTKHGKTRMAKAKFSYVYRRKTGHQGLLIAT